MRYKIIFVLIFILLYLLNIYIDYIPLNQKRKVYLKDLDISIVDINKTVWVDTNNFFSTSFHDWGLKKSSLLKKREKNIKEKSKKDNKLLKIKDKNFDIKNRVVCLDKECWEFMGIIKIGNSLGVTLLSKKKNSKLKTFKVGDLLLNNLKIIDINQETLLLLDMKKNKKISLKLFDVDISKYKPKNVKETKKETN